MKENHYNCIYMYVNKINGRKYVGQAVNFNNRHKEHRSASANETPIDRSFNKYGEENFEIIILKENLQTQCLLNMFEYYYIKKYNTLAKNKKGYNVSNGGSNGNPFSGKTEEEMEEVKQKISEARKGQKLSESTKQKISEVRKGQKLSEEHKQKISKTRIEKEISKGENNPMFGKRHTEESKRKMSDALKGKTFSEEYRQKISKATKGKNNPKSKRVAQYDLNENLIKIWDYAKQISEEISEINYSGLRAVLQGRTKTNQYKGFVWKYYEEDK